MNKITSIVPQEHISSKIYLIRDQKVMLDYDLAALYSVETRALVQAVKRNLERFPPHFMFQLNDEEFANWRSQIVMSNPGSNMGLRRAPYAFTEQGVAMLSAVLRSKTAIGVSIAIMDTFVRMREVLATHKEVARKIEEHDHHIAALYDYVRQIMAQEETPKNPIGYVKPEKD